MGRHPAPDVPLAGRAHGGGPADLDVGPPAPHLGRPVRVRGDVVRGLPGLGRRAAARGDLEGRRQVGRHDVRTLGDVHRGVHASVADLERASLVQLPRQVEAAVRALERRRLAAAVDLLPRPGRGLEGPVRRSVVVDEAGHAALAPPDALHDQRVDCVDVRVPVPTAPDVPARDEERPRLEVAAVRLLVDVHRRHVGVGLERVDHELALRVHPLVRAGVEDGRGDARLERDDAVGSEGGDQSRDGGRVGQLDLLLGVVGVDDEYVDAGQPPGCEVLEPVFVDDLDARIVEAARRAARHVGAVAELGHVLPRDLHEAGVGHEEHGAGHGAVAQDLREGRAVPAPEDGHCPGIWVSEHGRVDEGLVELLVRAALGLFVREKDVD